jgi:hypothetical protein
MNLSFIYLFTYGLSLVWAAASAAELFENLRVSSSGNLYYRFYPVFHNGTDDNSCIKWSRLSKSYYTKDGAKISEATVLDHLEQMERDYQKLIAEFPDFEPQKSKMYGSVEISKGATVLKKRSSTIHRHDRSLRDVNGVPVDFKRMLRILRDFFRPTEPCIWLEIWERNYIKQHDEPWALQNRLSNCYLSPDQKTLKWLSEMASWNRPKSLAFVLSLIQMTAEKRTEVLSDLFRQALVSHSPEVCWMLLEQPDFAPDMQKIKGLHQGDTSFWNASPFRWSSEELIDLAAGCKALDFLTPSGDEMQACPTVIGALAMIDFTRHHVSTLVKNPKANPWYSYCVDEWKESGCLERFQPAAFLEGLAKNGLLSEEDEAVVRERIMAWQKEKMTARNSIMEW